MTSVVVATREAKEPSVDTVRLDDALDNYEQSRRAATGKIERTAKERREAQDRHCEDTERPDVKTLPERLDELSDELEAVARCLEVDVVTEAKNEMSSQDTERPDELARLREEREGTHALLAHFRDDRRRLSEALRAIVDLAPAEPNSLMRRAQNIAFVAVRDTEQEQEVSS